MFESVKESDKPKEFLILMIWVLPKAQEKGKQKLKKLGEIVFVCQSWHRKKNH